MYRWKIHKDHGKLVHTDHGKLVHTDHGKLVHTDHGKLVHKDHRKLVHTDHRQLVHTGHGKLEKSWNLKYSSQGWEKILLFEQTMKKIKGDAAGLETTDIEFRRNRE